MKLKIILLVTAVLVLGPGVYAQGPTPGLQEDLVIPVILKNLINPVKPTFLD